MTSGLRMLSGGQETIACRLHNKRVQLIIYQKNIVCSNFKHNKVQIGTGVTSVGKNISDVI